MRDMIKMDIDLLRMRNVSDKRCRENQNTFYVQKLPPPPP